tara:strand:+ start:9818 stop:10450 length:633 start_codon:yes stop_codon:yes gene_type:complete
MAQNTDILQKAIDWQSFFDTDQHPSIGYDPVNDQILVLRSTNSSHTDHEDMLIYDMRTGSWSLCKGAIANVSVSNFAINGSSELVVWKIGTDDIDKWQPSPQATANFKWTSKAFDFKYPALKKKLYKVIVHAKKGENTVIKVGYDNGTTSDVFASNTFNTSASLTKNEFTVSSPTAFSYLTLEIVSSGGSTHADFEVNDIALVYRILRAH